MRKMKNGAISRVEFVRRREQLGVREVVAPAMGVSRQTLFRWETSGYHPVPPWAVILLGFLEQKYRGRGIPDRRVIDRAHEAARRQLVRPH